MNTFDVDFNDHVEVENSANKIFMDSFLGHIRNLHNRELILSAAESDRFMKMLAARPKEENAKLLYCGNGNNKFFYKHKFSTLSTISSKDKFEIQNYTSATLKRINYTLDNGNKMKFFHQNQNGVKA